MKENEILGVLIALFLLQIGYLTWAWNRTPVIAAFFLLVFIVQDLLISFFYSELS